MTAKVKKAISLFEEGFSCSQAVFAAFSGDFGLNPMTSLKISQALGGGMAHLGEACGAVTGAFLLIGLKYGRTKADDLEARDKTYAVMRQFADKFKALHGALPCRCLLGLDLGTEDGLRLAREKNLFQTLCVKYVEHAAEIVEDLL